MTPKDLTKLFAILCVFSALVMGIFTVYESYSRGATSHDWDWPLRTYLHFGSLTFAGLLFKADNRNKTFNFIGLRVKWWAMYLISVLAFYFVSATNVTDYSLMPEDYDKVKVIAHMIFTALVAFSASIIGWHYFPKGSKQRYMSLGPITVGMILFGASLLSKTDNLTTAMGETAVTLGVLSVVWVIINEQIEDKL